MADYQKMYAVLCGAIDNALDDLQTIPLAYPCARRLHDALMAAEKSMWIQRSMPQRQSLKRLYSLKSTNKKTACVRT